MAPFPSKNRENLSLDFDFLNKAINTAKEAFKFFTAGIPLIKKGPRGESRIDVPIMYMDFAIDRIHFDPQSKTPSPKGMAIIGQSDLDLSKIREIVDEVLKEAEVIEAAEFRKPEKAWIFPVAWRNLIVMHIKVSYNGEELVPDYGLTQEVRRHVN